LGVAELMDAKLVPRQVFFVATSWRRAHDGNRRMKSSLGRVSVPTEMIAEARRLGKAEHATLSQVVRRALQKEIDRMRAGQRSLTGQDVASTQHLPIEQAKFGSSQGKDR
jgi:hypothetical protein